MDRKTRDQRQWSGTSSLQTNASQRGRDFILFSAVVSRQLVCACSLGDDGASTYGYRFCWRAFPAGRAERARLPDVDVAHQPRKYAKISLGGPKFARPETKDTRAKRTKPAINFQNYHLPFNYTSNESRSKQQPVERSRLITRSSVALFSDCIVSTRTPTVMQPVFLVDVRVIASFRVSGDTDPSRPVIMFPSIRLRILSTRLPELQHTARHTHTHAADTHTLHTDRWY